MVLQQLRTDINNSLLEDYTAAREYVALFEEYRKVYTFGRTWSHDEYVAKVSMGG